MGHRSSIRKVVRTPPDIIRRRILQELNRLDFLPVLENRLRDAVHAIHDLAVRGQDDGEREIRLINQTHMLEEGAPRGSFALSEPGPVQFTYASDGHKLPRE